MSEWNGEGLPPVGTVCEIRAHKLNDWSPATIKFAARNVIVWDWEAEPALNGLCTAYAYAIEIRPIRTPEQIAAEERNSGIDAILDAYTYTVGPCTHKLAYSQAMRLYDAGIRKVQP